MVGAENFTDAAARAPERTQPQWAKTTASIRAGESGLETATGLTASIVGRRNENGGFESSRLRNHRRTVDGSATRAASLTVGAASSIERFCWKRRCAALLRAIKL